MSNLMFQSLNKLDDKLARDAFVDAHIRNTVAFQIRALRREEKWSQERLAEKAGTKPTQITRIENPSYGSHTISTLRRIASAFDVALIVRFVPFSELLRWDSGSRNIAPRSYWREVKMAKGPTQRSDTAVKYLYDFSTGRPMTGASQFYLIAPASLPEEKQLSGEPKITEIEEVKISAQYS